jgi:hypothetical protein
LRFNGFSIQWDGGCYPGHMMMRDAYYGPDGEETHGRYMMDPKNIEAVMRFCAERHLRLNTLCVGTKAHEENLRTLESLATEHDIRSLRWILVHSPFIEAEQVRRYARLNFAVTTTMTYLFGMGEPTHQLVQLARPAPCRAKRIRLLRNGDPHIQLAGFAQPAVSLDMMFVHHVVFTNGGHAQPMMAGDSASCRIEHQFGIDH